MRLAVRLIATIICLLPAVVPAAYITLRTDADAVLTNAQVLIHVKMTNLGDEAAHALQVAAMLDEARSVGPVHSELGTNSVLDETLYLSNAILGTGSYYAVLSTHYTDANGYPFSAVSLLPFIAGSQHEFPPLLVRLESLRLMGKGVLRLKLKNTAREDLDVRIQLILPDELSCSTPEQNVMLFAGQERELKCPLTNFSGRLGSRYAIYALAEYNLGAWHYSVATPAEIAIDEPRPFFARRMTVWVTLICVLLLLAVILQLGVKRHQTAGDHDKTDR